VDMKIRVFLTATLVGVEWLASFPGNVAYGKGPQSQSNLPGIELRPLGQS
jgi:hypothetical protein